MQEENNENKEVPVSPESECGVDVTFPEHTELGSTITPEEVAAPETIPVRVEVPATEIEVSAEQERFTQLERPRADNAQMDMEILVPLAKEYDENKDVLLCLPAEEEDVIKSVLDNMPNIDITKTTSGEEWYRTTEAAFYSTPFQGAFKKTLRRKNAKFRQFVDSEKGPMGTAAPRFNDSTGRLTGAAAVMRVRSLAGLGSVVRVPLWHSGFWISIKAPGDGALLELHRRLSEEKITLGRVTYGLAFANNSVMYTGWLMDFAISHIYDSTLHAELQPNMREHISCFDIPTVIWALACVIWPGGFPYARALLDPHSQETITIKEKVLIGKMFFTDTASLTPWQVSHMANSHGNMMTESSIKRYREEFTRGKGRSVPLNDSLSVNIRNPSLDQYLTSGQKWINGIVNMVDRAFASPPNDGVRDNYILNQGKATNMRQFIHFVESFIVDGSTVDDADTVEDIINNLSENDEIRDIFFKEVREYIEDSTVSLIAIPAEHGEKAPLPRFPHLIAIDPLSVFFILLEQRIPRIVER